MSEASSFTVQVTMESRWVPQFLGLLREMERLGRIGSSRNLGFFADGDGDYHPRFQWTTDVGPADPTTDHVQSDFFWDAG